MYSLESCLHNHSFYPVSKTEPFEERMKQFLCIRAKGEMAYFEATILRRFVAPTSVAAFWWQSLIFSAKEIEAREEGTMNKSTREKNLYRKLRAYVSKFHVQKGDKKLFVELWYCIFLLLSDQSSVVIANQPAIWSGHLPFSPHLQNSSRIWIYKYEN